MTVSEEDFQEAFLKKLQFIGYSDEEYLTEPLNGEKICLGEEDAIELLYCFLENNNLPWEISTTFPWTKYFKGSIPYELKQYIKKWRGRKYDKDYFEPEQPLYYETLKNHLFHALDRINGKEPHSLQTTINEKCFRDNFLETFPKFRSKRDKLSTLALNSVDEVDCQLFFYRFLFDNNLPMNIHFNFPWEKHFKRGLIDRLIERIKKWRGMEYDKDFLEPEEPLYYETLKNHLFASLEKMENRNHE